MVYHLRRSTTPTQRGEKGDGGVYGNVLSRNLPQRPHSSLAGPVSSPQREAHHINEVSSAGQPSELSQHFSLSSKSESISLFARRGIRSHRRTQGRASPSGLGVARELRALVVQVDCEISPQESACRTVVEDEERRFRLELWQESDDSLFRAINHKLLSHLVNTEEDENIARIVLIHDERAARRRLKPPAVPHISPPDEGLSASENELLPSSDTATPVEEVTEMEKLYRDLLKADAEPHQSKAPKSKKVIHQRPQPKKKTQYSLSECCLDERDARQELKYNERVGRHRLKLMVLHAQSQALVDFICLDDARGKKDIVLRMEPEVNAAAVRVTACLVKEPTARSMLMAEEQFVFRCLTKVHSPFVVVETKRLNKTQLMFELLDRVRQEKELVELDQGVAWESICAQAVLLKKNFQSKERAEFLLVASAAHSMLVMRQKREWFQIVTTYHPKMRMFASTTQNTSRRLAWRLWSRNCRFLEGKRKTVDMYNVCLLNTTAQYFSKWMLFHTRLSLAAVVEQKTLSNFRLRYFRSWWQQTTVAGHQFRGLKKIADLRDNGLHKRYLQKWRKFLGDNKKIRAAVLMQQRNERLVVQRYTAMWRTCTTAQKPLDE